MEEFTVNGIRQVEPRFNSNDFAQYLSDIDAQTANVHESIESVTLANPTRGILFYFVHVTELDVLEAFQKVRSNAIGLDGIPLRLVKLICLCIFHTFNISLIVTTENSQNYTGTQGRQIFRC